MVISHFQRSVPLAPVVRVLLWITLLWIALFCITTSLMAESTRSPVIPDDRITIGPYGGYSRISGFYEGKLDPSIRYGLYVTLPINNYLMADGLVTTGAHEFTHSSNSFLYSYELALTPLLYYDIHNIVRLFGGAGLDLRYLRVNAVLTGRQEKAFKAGYLLTAGTFVKISQRVSLRAGADYTSIWLSGEPLVNNTFSLGVSYTMAAGEPEEYRDQARMEMRSNLEQARNYYKKGVDALGDKNSGNARDYFKMALRLNPGMDEAREKLDDIDAAENAFAEARVLLQKKRYYEAIPYLVHASEYIDEADKKLAETRNRLAARVQQLEQSGIEAFNEKNYEQCISIMRKVLLIDPENKTARVYMSRARKYLETVEKFQ